MVSYELGYRMLVCMSRSIFYQVPGQANEPTASFLKINGRLSIRSTKLWHAETRIPLINHRFQLLLLKFYGLLTAGLIKL